jgi:predicted Zn-dependent protease
MKKSNIIAAVISVCIICMLSCGKNMAPATLKQEVKNKTYDSVRFDYFFVEAVKQKLMGNSGEALERLELCLRINPESDAAYFQKAQIAMGLGDRAHAKIYARKAYAIAPDNFWYLMMLAGLYYNDNNIDSAIIYYERASTLFPEKEDVLLMLGNLYSESGKYENADEVYKKFDTKYGINETSTVASIKNLMLAKKYEEALAKTNILLKEFPEELLYNRFLAEIYRAKGENTKAMDVYRKLIENNPDNPDTQLSFCDFLVNSKNYSDLFTFLNNVLLNEKVSREDKISLLGHLIEIPELVKDYGNNLNVVVRILEASYPDDDIIVLLRPDLLVNQNKLNDASIRLEEIISKKPDNYFAWEKLLIIYLQAKNFKKLQERGKECATRFNRSFIAKMLYASGATENGDYDIALDELRKASILAGDTKEMVMQVLSLKADVYYRQKKYKEAFDTFEEALKTDSGDLTILNNYAYYLAEQNMRLKEAEEMAEKVISIEKNNTTFLDTYGWVLYKRGKIKEAQKVMEAIISSGEKPDSEWYEHLGYIMKRRNDCKNAVINWNIALKLDSTKTDIKEEIRKCQGL